MRKRHDAPPGPDDRKAIEPLPPYPHLDLERYRPMLNGCDMTDAQKDYHLKAVWRVMTMFVDQAFDQPTFFDSLEAREAARSPEKKDAPPTSTKRASK